MTDVADGPSSRVAPPFPSDPLAAPRAAVRAELQARAAAPGAGDGDLPPRSVLDQRIWQALLELLEEGGRAQQAGAVLLAPGGPPPRSARPCLELVSSGADFDNVFAAILDTASTHGQRVLLVTNRPAEGTGASEPPPERSPEQDALRRAREALEQDALRRAREALEQAEQFARAAADTHNRARAAIQEGEAWAEHNRAEDELVTRTLGLSREAAASALGVGRLVEELSGADAARQDGLLRQLLVAAEVAVIRAEQRDEVLASLQHHRRSGSKRGLWRHLLRRRRDELHRSRRDHAQADAQLASARSLVADAQRAADDAARRRLAAATGAASQSSPQDAVRRKVTQVTTARRFVLSAAKARDSTVSSFDVVVVEEASRLPLAMLLPFCAAAERQLVLQVGAGEPPVPVCSDPAHRSWLAMGVGRRTPTS